MLNLQPTPYDLQFRLLGFPVRVHPFFWLVIALLGTQGNIGDMSIWLIRLVIWVVAAFLSILVHELGHALVFRHVMGVQSHIVFYGLGGMTIPVSIHQRSYDLRGMLREVFLSFAGPLAGFLLALCSVLVLVLINSIAMDSPDAFFGMMSGRHLDAKTIVNLFLSQLAFISIFWGLFNLLPIFPMDGGQISREIFSYFSPRHGIANSLGLSLVVAVGIALLAFKYKMFFIAILFVFFAIQNYLELTSRSSGYR